MFKVFVFSILFFTTSNFAIANEPNCQCNGLAGNMPAVTLIHTSIWGNSGLKIFSFQDYDDADLAFNACSNLIKELTRLKICHAK